MKCVIVFAASLAMMFSTEAGAQGRDSRDDGAAARTDAMLGTPNRTTPVPQTNKFSTAPGLEQQTPAPPLRGIARGGHVFGQKSSARFVPDVFEGYCRSRARSRAYSAFEMEFSDTRRSSFPSSSAALKPTA